MDLAVVVDAVVHDHSQMHARLADWDEALAQLKAGDFFQSQLGLQRLWRLVPFFEEEVPRHFRQEEAELFPAMKAKHPDAQASLAHFAEEHADILRQWKSYRGELLYCDAVGETRRVSELGHWLISRLRQHMQEEELELVPLAQQA